MNSTDKPKLRLTLSPDYRFLGPYIEREWAPCDLANPAEEADIKIEVESSGVIRINNATLRTGHIVGTGMTGWPMGLARRVMRATYIRSPKGLPVMGQKVKVVHAIDIARATKLLKDASGSYWLDDGTDTTVDELANAFAARIQNKRIPLFPHLIAKIAMWLFPLKVEDHDLKAPQDQKIEGLEPHEVVRYLKTHQYGPEDI